MSSQPFGARDPKLWMRRLNRRVPPFFPRPTTCIPCPPSKAHKPTLFCPIFKQCIPLFYRRAHKCGKKGCKWGSNINLYYLIPATSSKPLLRALHGNTHNSHSGLWFLQGNAIRWNWQRNVSELNKSLSTPLSFIGLCVWVLLIICWSDRVGIWREIKQL